MLTKLPIAAGTNVLEMLQTRFPGYHPLLSIAEIAHTDAARDDLQLQFSCHKTIAEYILPKLRAVEHSGAVENQRRVIVQLFRDDIEDGQLVEDKQETGLSDTELLQITEHELSQIDNVSPEDLIPAATDVTDEDLLSTDDEGAIPMDSFALQKLCNDDFD